MQDNCVGNEVEQEDAAVAQPVCAEQAAHPLREYGPLVVQGAATSVPENPVAQEPVTIKPAPTFKCSTVTK